MFTKSITNPATGSLDLHGNGIPFICANPDDTDRKMPNDSRTSVRRFITNQHAGFGYIPSESGCELKVVYDNVHAIQ